ncbi:MAG: flagellar biosynthesis anti-sigma factor FlgM [Pseudomonadota bacterium]
MKIVDTIKPATTQPLGQTQTSAAKNTEKTAPTAVVSDSVHLSSQQQVGQLASGGVFDTRKVEKIKLAIADGQFQVNSEKVADGLLETVRDLLHARKR